MNDLLYRRLFSDLPTLYTERLVLRRFRSDDLYDVNEYCSKEEVPRFLMWTPHLNLKETQGYLDFMMKRYRKGQNSDFAIALQGSGKVIGNCGFTSVDLNHECCELGYVLSSDYWGKGYMDEAFEALLAAAFDRLEAHRAVLRILDGNDHSVAFAIRHGFRKEGTEQNAFFVKGEYRTVHHFAMLKSEYLERKQGIR
ncbi:MAG: GNAT family N-acetyltransferase [Clostridiales bacterium]|nr:GNAT family N-acetyltransferase [Candidatus Coliplasma caballi]